MINDFLTEEQSKNIPVVRFKKVVLKNFKSVEYGEIIFNCGRRFIPYGTESDILGLYGQNGSGKTAFIEALAVLKALMSGKPVPDAYAECIALDADYAELEFTFDLQYTNNVIREACYSFCMSTADLTREDVHEKYKDIPEGFSVPEDEKRVVIFNEKFSLLWEEAQKRQLIIDTSCEDYAFSPDTKRKALAGNSNKTLIALEVNKKLAGSNSKSFIFMKETLGIFKAKDSDSVYFRVLAELRNYARYYLFVVDTKSSGLIRLNLALPIFTRSGRIVLDLRSPMSFKKDELEEINTELSNLSSVLGQLVPGLSIGFKTILETVDKDGNPEWMAMLMAYRDGIELPLREESDGVRKIISVLSLLISVFNEQSVTVAIDEFDAGIFEYLLGEILQTMEDSGKGQFIFTSHNLRPLEVINKKYLYFTTTNPRNRYFRFKNIAATNNLRDMYFREIILNEQEEEIYNRTKRFKMIAALKNAGGFY